jgi:hypothetical protein
MAVDTATLSPAQLYKMSPAQQNQYLASLPADQAAAEHQALVAYTQQVGAANQSYLRKAITKMVVCPPAGGGINQKYAANTSLVYNFPTAGGANIRELIIALDLKITPATGTSATYAWTPAGLYALFNQISITYGGNTLHQIRPYFLKLLDQIRNKMWLPYDQVLSGLNADSTVSTNISTGQPTLTGGTATTVKVRLRVPFQLHRLSPVGMLPIQGQGTAGQITLTCAPTIGAANPDPLNVPINFTGGSGNAITIDGTECTVTVYAVYHDGTNFESKDAMHLSLENLPATQYVIEPATITNLTAGSIQRGRIATLAQHYVVASVLVDGVQSTNFSTAANITGLEMDMDSAGQNKFFSFGAGNNTGYYDYAEQIRHIYGQDLDTGVILWVNGLQFNTVNPDDQNGAQVLDMRSGHWPDVNLGVQVGAVSSTNFTPRLETYLFSLNDQGLVIAG